MNSLDEAIDNLDKILAHILIEQDLRLKGIQIGHGWKQLKVIKETIAKLNFLDRRQYKKKLIEKENRLLSYEENFISEVELKLVKIKYMYEALEDVQKVNELINNYKTQVIIEKRKDIEEKLSIIKVELQRIYEKNKNKNDKKWIEMNNQISEIMVLIQNVLNSKDNNQFTQQREQMNQMLKTIYVQKRIKDEEEEELLKIAVEMEKLKNLERELDYKLYKDNESLSEIENKQGQQKQQQDQIDQQYNQAFQYVQMRRRTKIKLFFQGLFTAVGSFGGKIGAAFGLAFGTITGKQVSEKVTKSSID